MKYMDEKAKKMLLILVGIIVIMIFIFLIVFIIGRIKNSSLSYNEIEDKMVNAAKAYYSKNNDLLPINDTDEVYVEVSTLVSSGNMKELKEYQKDDSISCNGKVVVTKSGDYYNYSPYLNCSDKYITKYLYEELISSVVTDGDGLYQVEQYYDGIKGKTYIYRGEYPNNYVSIDDELWRIVKINNDNSIMIIQANYNKKINEAMVWDNRYNVNTDTYEGINVFETSRINRKLNNYYQNNALFSEAFKNNVVPRKLCISGRSIKDTVNDGSIECKAMSDYSVYFSLLQTNDFINASLDSNCQKIEDKSCGNYNYLNKFGSAWWFLTVNSKSYNKSYVADSSAYRRILSQTAVARVVTNLNKNVVYKSGNGTSKEPFVLK